MSLAFGAAGAAGGAFDELLQQEFRFFKQPIGIEFDPKKVPVVIKKIIPGTLAEAAGVQAGWELFRVNNVSIKDMPWEQAWQKLQTAEGELKDRCPWEMRTFRISDPDVEIILRTRPSLDPRAKAKEVLRFPATFQVSEIAYAERGQRFLRLADGRGWAFSHHPTSGRLLLQEVTPTIIGKPVSGPDGRPVATMVLGFRHPDAVLVKFELIHAPLGVEFTEEAPVKVKNVLRGGYGEFVGIKPSMVLESVNGEDIRRQDSAAALLTLRQAEAGLRQCPCATVTF